jgi:hypothetical protein
MEDFDQKRCGTFKSGRVSVHMREREFKGCAGCNKKDCVCSGGSSIKCNLSSKKNMLNKVVVTGKTLKQFPYSCPKGASHCYMCTCANMRIPTDGHSRRLSRKKEMKTIIRDSYFVYDGDEYNY